MVRELSLAGGGQGLHEITREVTALVEKSGLDEGLCTLFLQHTSASLTIQENADPSARHDLEQWLNRLVPEADPLFTHTLEGEDDMPSHIKSALTATSLSIPIIHGRLVLGTWQDVFLCDFDGPRSNRRVIVSVAF